MSELTKELVAALKELRGFYYTTVDPSCQKGQMQRCLCRDCTEKRADALILREEQTPDTMAKMRDLVEIQGRDGTWNYDKYLFGMYNGMELMLAMVEGREPKYRDWPESEQTPVPSGRVISEAMNLDLEDYLADYARMLIEYGESEKAGEVLLDRDTIRTAPQATMPTQGYSRDEEIYRLKVKCNTYAKRLVNEGFDDVAWEITGPLIGTEGGKS